MDTKSKPKTPTPNRKNRSSSSNSDANFESPPFVSPINSPAENSMAIVVVNKFTQFTPQPSPFPPENATAHVDSFSQAKAQPQVPPVTVDRAEGPPARPNGRSAAAVKPRGSRMVKVADLGFRIWEIVLCLISFSVMAADKTEGWSGDSFDRYIEYRYCLSVNVIGFAYSGFQAFDLSYHLSTGKYVIGHHFRCQFNFLMDQIIAYLLISASSSAATRVVDWQSNWGKDEFTVMATASVAMAFLAFVAFAVSSIISGYQLWNNGSS